MADVFNIAVYKLRVMIEVLVDPAEDPEAYLVHRELRDLERTVIKKLMKDREYDSVDCEVMDASLRDAKR